MSTYLELQQRVANDYLNRTDYGSEVKRSILAAVRFYERRRWRFNETVSALAASAGQTFLTLPSNFLILDRLEVEIDGGAQRYSLNERQLDHILDMQDSSATDAPTDYTLRGNKIELGPIPASAYSCPCYYVKTLSELSADADSNSWTTGAMQDVIVYHATKLMWANVIRNTQEALKFNQLEMAALSVITSENEQFAHGYIRPTYF